MLHIRCLVLIASQFVVFGCPGVFAFDTPIGKAEETYLFTSNHPNLNDLSITLNGMSDEGTLHGSIAVSQHSINEVFLPSTLFFQYSLELQRSGCSLPELFTVTHQIAGLLLFQYFSEVHSMSELPLTINDLITNNRGGFTLRRRTPNSGEYLILKMDNVYGDLFYRAEITYKPHRRSGASAHYYHFNFKLLAQTSCRDEAETYTSHQSDDYDDDRDGCCCCNPIGGLSRRYRSSSGQYEPIPPDGGSRTNHQACNYGTAIHRLFTIESEVGSRLPAHQPFSRSIMPVH